MGQQVAQIHERYMMMMMMMMDFFFYNGMHFYISGFKCAVFTLSKSKVS